MTSRFAHRLASAGRRTIQGAAIGLLALAPVAPALGGEILCRPNYDWAVEVDGSFPDKAVFYQTNVAKKFLIDVPSIDSGLLLDLGARKIYTLPRSQISASDGDLLKLRDGVPAGTTAYAFTLEGRLIQFTAGDRRVRILPVLDRPPIVGPVSVDDLLADRPEYRAGMKNYVPEADSLKVIRGYGKPVEMDVFFATWCSHCKVFMPKFLRAVQDAKNPKVRLNLVGVPKGFGTEPGPWAGRDIRFIPTVIVKVNGQEITRLGSHEGSLPEVELAGILQAVR